MISGLLTLAIWLASLCVVAVTCLPMSKTHKWWIRMWDFPRLHILIVAVVLALIGAVVYGTQATVLVLMLAACAAYQAWQIFPFTRFAREEVALIEAPEGTAVQLLASNVLMENEEHERLIELIEEEKPDILFLMETNQRWADALEETLSSFDTVLSHPTEQHYGMIFASNIETESAEVVFLVDDDTPTLLAELRTPGGEGFYFIGMHPRPPLPGDDTDERDAQIKRAATLSKSAKLPVISMGDFNDVAWSWTAKRFKHHGKFRDPRVGRGMLPSFDANHPILRFPIDQLYLGEGVDLVSFDRKRAIGSDHFPMSAVVSISPEEKDED